MSTRRPSEWVIHGERVVDDTRRAVLSIVAVELPDGVRFEQYVLRAPAAAIVLVLDDAQRVLMMHRHRFVLGCWVWELPGGYLDPDEDPMVCAAREVEEETGWRPRSMEPLVTVQPMVSTIDQPNRLYLARGADPTGNRPDINEAETVRWVPLDEARDLMANGAIVGAGSVTGLLAVLLARAEGRL
ncbi:MAG TPA: NUDIX hydrolase [Micromonosporaceae bacterium]|nr:NUDIX hydrolase [Micromonosporaceae bacterium]